MVNRLERSWAEFGCSEIEFVAILLCTSGSGWQSLSRPWQFPRGSPPLPPPHSSLPLCLLIIQEALAAGSWLLSSRSGALCLSLVISSSCVWEDKSYNAPKPRVFSPAHLTDFLRFRVDPRIFCSFPLSLAQLHSGCVAQPACSQLPGRASCLRGRADAMSK